MNLKEIKEMIALMKENEINEFQLERDGFKVVLKKGLSDHVSVQTLSQPATPAPAAPAPVENTTSKEAEKAAVDDGTLEITSPMVGTFYRASSPDTDPFINVGDAVSEETVVCIVEAMKVMNEIKAELKGVVTEILVENGEAVEFGQPLFKVKKS